jgi:formyl-CoA transferase/CoA:oxalate CoA-transferase
MEASLEGVRVLDLSHALAGPYCTLLLSHFGATVYKLEPPEGEIGRGWGPPFTGDESSYFLGLNAGKQGLVIDLKKADGVDLCLRLIERCDVLLENFRPGTMDRLGLGYETVRARNPRLIYCSISGYGQTGPRRDEPAMDLILQASSGLMSFTGTTEGELVRCGHSVADITAGMFALIGILLALRSREMTGAGQYIDVSMLDSMISAMASGFANYFGSGEPPKPRGTSFASIVPYRAYPAADRELVIAIGSEKLWATFCRVIGRPEMADSPDYATNADRIRNRESLDAELFEILRRKPAAEWMAAFRESGIPHSPIRTLDEVAGDPQALVRNMFPRIDHGRAGVFPVTGVPIKMSATPGCVRGGAPALGEHTRAVLSELLEIPAEEFNRLLKSGVVRSAE